MPNSKRASHNKRASTQHRKALAPPRDTHPEYGPWGGLPIEQMIYWTNDYVVYIDERINIDFRMDKTIPESHVPEFNRILNEASFLETAVSNEFPKATKIQCKGLIGEAIACAIDEDFGNASLVLASARAFVQARSREISRMWFVGACCFVAIPILALECLVWIFRDQVRSGIGDIVFWFTLCAGAGATGALLSVISRGGTLQFDASSGKSLHRTEGASRILAGVISGVVAGIAVESGLVLTAFTNGHDKKGFILLLLAVAAGASERFAASLLSDVNATGFKAAKDGTSVKNEGKIARSRPKNPNKIKKR